MKEQATWAEGKEQNEQAGGWLVQRPWGRLYRVCLRNGQEASERGGE